MTRRAPADGLGQSSVISGTSSPPCRSTRISERSSSCSNLTRTLDGPLSSMRYDQPVDGVGSSASEMAPFAKSDDDRTAGTRERRCRRRDRCVGPGRAWWLGEGRRRVGRRRARRRGGRRARRRRARDARGWRRRGRLRRRSSGLGGWRPHCRSVVVGDQHAGGEDDGCDGRSSGEHGAGGRQPASGTSPVLDVPERAVDVDRPGEALGVTPQQRSHLRIVEVVEVVEVVVVVRHRSPPSFVRNDRRASCRCDLTEPGAIPIAVATSSTESPST